MCALNSGCLLGKVNLDHPPLSWGSECVGTRAHVSTPGDQGPRVPEEGQTQLLVVPLSSSPCWSVGAILPRAESVTRECSDLKLPRSGKQRCSS